MPQILMLQEESILKSDLDTDQRFYLQILIWIIKRSGWFPTLSVMI